MALSTALVTAISCAVASMNAAMALRVAGTVGAADLQVRHVAKDRIDAAVLDTVRANPEVALAVPRSREAVWLARADNPTVRAPATLDGIDIELDDRMYPNEPTEGHRPRSDGEVVLRDRVAEALHATLGDEILVGEGDRAVRARVVGISRTAPLDIFDKPGGMAAIPTLARASATEGKFRSIGITLRDSADPRRVAEALGAAMPPDVMVRESERVTSRIDSLVRINDLMFYFCAVLAYAGSAVIVLTGLTTAVLERQRELAVVRCIGGTRSQLGAAQLGVGAVIGSLGAILGVPLGVGLAAIVTWAYPERLPAGLHIWPMWLVWSGAGAVVAGLAGALWPAIRAARSRPIAAMASKAVRASGWGVVLAGVLGVALIVTEFFLINGVDDPEHLFPVHPFIGMPMLLAGWFLVSVPLVWAMGRFAGPIVCRLLRVPHRAVMGSVASAPYRNGFTAGALMVGLGMMTAVYTNGTGLLRDWIDAIRFPDAFVNGVFVGITPDMRHRIEALDFVERTCAITILKIDAPTFGISRFIRPKTNFIAFEPEQFFEMTRLHWVAGDPDHALRRLEEGGAVLVSQEFLVHRTEYSVGSMYPIDFAGKHMEFEIVGAVSSPGLDLVSKYFSMEDDYSENAIHAVFGTRADLKKHFGTDAIHLLQIQLQGAISDEDAVVRMREAAGTPGLYFGSARSIKDAVFAVGRSMMSIASIVAFGAMVVGSMGVVNVVIAGIDARRFEFGVLRSVGASGSTVARMIIAEVVIIALGACIAGLGMGLQASWAGVRMYALIAGLEIQLIPPAIPLAAACCVLIGISVVSILPMVIGVGRTRPRVLLGATRG